MEFPLNVLSTRRKLKDSRFDKRRSESGNRLQISWMNRFCVIWKSKNARRCWLQKLSSHSKSKFCWQTENFYAMNEWKRFFLRQQRLVCRSLSSIFNCEPWTRIVRFFFQLTRVRLSIDYRHDEFLLSTRSLCNFRPESLITSAFYSRLMIVLEWMTIVSNWKWTLSFFCCDVIAPAHGNETNFRELFIQTNFFPLL